MDPVKRYQSFNRKAFLKLRRKRMLILLLISAYVIALPVIIQDYAPHFLNMAHRRVFSRPSEAVQLVKASLGLKVKRATGRQQWRSFPFPTTQKNHPAEAFSPPLLIQAAKDCSLDEAKALIAAGHKVDITDGAGDTPLAWAAKRNCLVLAEFLLEHGADANTSSRNGFTPYVWARLYDSGRVGKVLIEAGAEQSGSFWWQ